MSQFPKADEVCRIAEPNSWTPEKEQLMVDACREFATFHYENCSDIKFLYDRNGFDPSSIKVEADLARIPPLGVTAMKHFLLTSLPHDQSVLTLTSSGTSGQKTQIWFDQDSLDRVQGMMDGLWAEKGLTSDTPTNYLAFIYDPEQANDLGIAFTAKNEMRFTPIKDSFFAVKKNESGQWEFRLEETIKIMRRYEAEGAPVRLLGIPSFLFELVLELESRGETMKFPAESAALIGGGWKAAEDKKVTKEEFRARVEKTLGISQDRMQDLYGMAEHSAPYCSCVENRIHVPVYNRIMVRDPETMKVLPDGEVGLIELITPYNAMIPNLAILSTDLGYLYKDPCPCGSKSPSFGLVGRGGLKKHKGCAITAGEIVKRGKK